MASRNKKTTMAKLSREAKLRERRLDKQARKEARRNAPPEPEPGSLEALIGDDGEPAAPHEEERSELAERPALD